VLAHGLARLGHDVVAVADGAEAVTALATARYDVLIADIVMPVMDGIALALKASSDHPALKIVLVTGYAAELARAQPRGPGPARREQALFHRRHGGAGD
jgi:CheY-like chemotaxis protein